jgi:hypothetical protein
MVKNKKTKTNQKEKKRIEGWKKLLAGRKCHNTKPPHLQSMKVVKPKPPHLLFIRKKDVKTIACHSNKNPKKHDMKWHNISKTNYIFFLLKKESNQNSC